MRPESKPSSVMPIEDLAGAIRRAIGQQQIERATETWRIVRAAATALAVPVNLPDGTLLWLCDYD